MVLIYVYVIFAIESAILEFVLSVPLHTTHYSVTTRERSESTIVNVLSRILNGINTTSPESLLESLINEDADASLLDQQITFPDVYEILFNPVIRGTPKCANGLSVCDKIDQYPYTHIKNVLQNTNGHNEYFGVDEVPTEIVNRVGESTEDFLCASLDETIFPKAGMNKNNKWKYIINQGDQFVQGVRVEKCLKMDSSCNLITDAPIGYVTSCKQKYILRRLLSLTGNGQPEPDSFYIPSSCCCTFKKDASFLAEYKRSATSHSSR